MSSMFTTHDLLMHSPVVTTGDPFYGCPSANCDERERAMWTSQFWGGPPEWASCNAIRQPQEPTDVKVELKNPNGCTFPRLSSAPGPVPGGRLFPDAIGGVSFEKVANPAQRPVQGIPTIFSPSSDWNLHQPLVPITFRTGIGAVLPYLPAQAAPVFD